MCRALPPQPAQLNGQLSNTMTLSQLSITVPIKLYVAVQGFTCILVNIRKATYAQDRHKSKSPPSLLL